MPSPLRLIRLAQPVRRDGSMWAALLLRRPTLADHHAVASADSLGEQQVALLARLCDVPVAVIRELAWSDFRTLHEALRSSCD